jgi:hypothetical protein
MQLLAHGFASSRQGTCSLFIERTWPAGTGLVTVFKFPKPSMRPICVTDVWRRLAVKGPISNAQFKQYSKIPRRTM